MYEPDPPRRRNRIEPDQPVKAHERADSIAYLRHLTEQERDALTVRDPRGRHMSLAITHLEDAEMRLRAVHGMDTAEGRSA